ncbi:uncharacterized protein TNCV_134461 [Trichonephila clavipes]|nr:uncharacterized protein TNCV_134461 [Trichonephila clavipes]
MKQDLEKAENAYLSSFTSKKSKTLPGATTAAHGDPNGKNDYQKKKKSEKRIISNQGFSDLSEQQEALMVEVIIPICYKQAIRSRDASTWRDAMDKEINVMMERKVWDLVDHPDNINFKTVGFIPLNMMKIIKLLDTRPAYSCARWSLKASMYDFDIKYKKGSTNVEADMLTRNPIAYHVINTPPEPLLDINETSHFQNIENTSAPKCFKRDGVFVVKRQGLTKIIVPKAS